MRRARDGAQGHRNGPRNNNIETEADKRLRTSLIVSERSEHPFLVTIVNVDPCECCVFFITCTIRFPRNQN